MHWPHFSKNPKFTNSPRNGYVRHWSLPVGKGARERASEPFPPRDPPNLAQANARDPPYHPSTPYRSLAATSGPPHIATLSHASAGSLKSQPRPIAPSQSVDVAHSESTPTKYSSLYDINRISKQYKSTQ